MKYQITYCFDILPPHIKTISVFLLISVKKLKKKLKGTDWLILINDNHSRWKKQLNKTLKLKNSEVQILKKLQIAYMWLAGFRVWISISSVRIS